MDDIKIDTVEMHTGGEPLRIVTAGLPVLHGETLLEKRRYLRDNLDHIRKFLIFEPRGHYDMYGVYIVEPDMKDADFGCIFFHNEGYSTMCGHAVIALGRYAVDRGLVQKATAPETRVVMQCPCGLVEAFVEYDGEKTGSVRFNSVPAFLFQKDVEVDVAGRGNILVDVGYGGAFYALLPVDRLGLSLAKSSVQELKQAAGLITETLKPSLQLRHPDNADLAFLYGTILTDGNDAGNSPESANMCVFADKEVDRSPCGSGVTARIAQHFQRGLVQLNETRVFRGPTGSKFKAKAVKQVTCGSHDAVIVEVSGQGHYSGTCSFTLEADDSIGKGFLLK